VLRVWGGIPRGPRFSKRKNRVSGMAAGSRVRTGRSRGTGDRGSGSARRASRRRCGGKGRSEQRRCRSSSVRWKGRGRDGAEGKRREEKRRDERFAAISGQQLRARQAGREEPSTSRGKERKLRRKTRKEPPQASRARPQAARWLSGLAPRGCLAAARSGRMSLIHNFPYRQRLSRLPRDEAGGLERRATGISLVLSLTAVLLRGPHAAPNRHSLGACQQANEFPSNTTIRVFLRILPIPKALLLVLRSVATNFRRGPRPVQI
jgi:hypothetical protein